MSKFYVKTEGPIIDLGQKTERLFLASLSRRVLESPCPARQSSAQSMNNKKNNLDLPAALCAKLLRGQAHLVGGEVIL